ncbi:MAG: hypothetical protein GX748_03900 [Lentisphaerae bacterium]|nr:hypothetical protein [Lentisphaerota bacterium]
MSEELAEYGATYRAERAEGSEAGMSPAEARRRGGPYGDGRAPLVTTIRWHRPAERMPAYGVAVVVWMEAINLTARAHRDAVSGSDDSWRICGMLASDDLVTAWTDAPNGPLPPPDGGAA